MSEAILVTGASGFIGRRLMARFRREGVDALGIGSSHGDIADPGTLRAVADRRFGHVVHLAGRTYVPDSWTNPLAFFQTNVVGTLNVLELCRTQGASMTLASAYVYGRPASLPVGEAAPAQPNNPYAHTKLLAEQLCRSYSGHFGVCVGVARIFNVFGPDQDSRFLIPTIFSQLLGNATVEVEDLSPRRDYVHLDDVVDAVTKLVAARPRMAIYNVASGTSRSVRDIIAILQAALGTSKPVVEKRGVRHNEIQDVVGDASRATADLGWRAQIDFDEGISRLVRDAVATNPRARA